MVINVNLYFVKFTQKHLIKLFFEILSVKRFTTNYHSEIFHLKKGSIS